MGSLPNREMQQHFQENFSTGQISQIWDDFQIYDKRCLIFLIISHFKVKKIHNQEKFSSVLNVFIVLPHII